MESCSIKRDDCYLALLPLAHVLELLAENLLLALGMPIGYSNPKTFLDSSSMVARGYKGDASVLRPTVTAVVPLVLDSIFKGIKVKMAQQGALFSEVVDFCFHYKLKWLRRGHSTPITDLIVFSKFKALLGGRMRAMLSGDIPVLSHRSPASASAITAIEIRWRPTGSGLARLLPHLLGYHSPSGELIVILDLLKDIVGLVCGALIIIVFRVMG